MKIKMLTSTPGALNNGLTVKLFQKGLVYPIDEMEGIDKVFLDIGVAEVYVVPEEVKRHEKGLSGAPVNKRAEVPENKELDTNADFHDVSDLAESDEDPDDGDDYFTLEELEGSKAKDIRELSVENDIDLTDFAKNTSAETLINAFLARQGTIEE